MTNITAGRWLLVAIAVVGLALVAPLVSAHGNDTTTDHPYNETDAPPHNGTAAEWEDWMESHMAEYMGPGSVAWMETHMGVSIEEMAQQMADGNYTGHSLGYGAPGSGGYGMHGTGYGGDYGTHADDTHRDDTHRGGYGMAGRGHGC